MRWPICWPRRGGSVTREFYYNDAGVQIATLALSVQARAKEMQGEVIAFPESGYRGEYIAEIARDYLARATIERDGASLSRAATSTILHAIQRSPSPICATNRTATSQRSACTSTATFSNLRCISDGKVDGRGRSAIVASGMTYEHEGALWLKTTAFGTHGELAGLGGPPADDKDRVMRKSDGTYTYFVPDVAYHTTKLQRGFDKVINVQGTDHYGTVARVRAGLQAAAKVAGHRRCRAAIRTMCCTRCCG